MVLKQTRIFIIEKCFIFLRSLLLWWKLNVKKLSTPFWNFFDLWLFLLCRKITGESSLMLDKMNLRIWSRLFKLFAERDRLVLFYVGLTRSMLSEIGFGNLTIADQIFWNLNKFLLAFNLRTSFDQCLFKLALKVRVEIFTPWANLTFSDHEKVE